VLAIGPHLGVSANSHVMAGSSAGVELQLRKSNDQRNQRVE
jgi:hypothetical protein